MELKPCVACKKKFPAKRETCPFCGAERAASGGGGGSSGAGWTLLVLILLLIVIKIYPELTRMGDPQPELGGQHSSEDAIRECREGIDSRLLGRGGTMQGSLEAEHLQSGEYLVRGNVIVTEGRSRIIKPVLCEARFRPEGGWTIEEVEIGS